jgi:branched-chain amino acid transport system substrate-binding protein
LGVLALAMATPLGCASRVNHADIVLAAQGATTAAGTAIGASGPEAASSVGSSTGAATAPASPGAAAAHAAGSTAGSSNSGNSSSGPASPTSVAGQQGPLAPILIGSVGTQSGIVGASISEGIKALQAWVSSVNAGGGLHGHPVKLLVGDDGGDPAQHRALVQQFVEQDHVLAFVYNDAPLTGQASVDYLNRKHIPVVGSELAGQWFYQSPYFFPEAASGLVLTDVSVRGVANVVVPQGKTKVAFLTCVEAQYCTDAARVWPGIAPQVGLQVVSNGSASLATPDFTSQCLNAQGRGAQVFIMAMDSNSVDRVAANCAAIGFRPVFSWASSVTIDRHRADPNLNGAVLPIPSAPWFLKSNAAIADFQATMARYAPGVIVGGSSENGWVSAKLFEAAASTLSATPTTSDILAGLWSLRSDDLGNLTIPLTFAKGQNAPPVECWYVATIGGGNWTSPDGGQRHCK